MTSAGYNAVSVACVDGAAVDGDVVSPVLDGGSIPSGNAPSLVELRVAATA